MPADCDEDTEMARKPQAADQLLRLDNQICFAVYSAAHAFNRVYKPLLDRLGLTYPQYLVMLVLWARDGVPVKHLFMEGRAVPTVLLWVPFFMVFMVLVTVTFWTPAVLHSVGFSLSAAALIIGLNNLGSVIASATSGWLVHRGGAFRVLIPGFILGGICLAWFGQATTSMLTLGTASFLAGFFVGGTGTGLIAVAAGMYPTSIRSTGIGWAMGMGRVGQAFGPLLTGILVGLGYQVGGIFYAAAVPCLIGALFLAFLYLSRPVMEADAEGRVAPAK